MFTVFVPFDVMTDSVLGYRNSIEVNERERNFVFETCVNIVNFQQMNLPFIQWNSDVFLHYCPQIMVSLLTSIFWDLTKYL